MSAVVSTASVSGGGLAPTLGLLFIMLMLVLLVQKEIANGMLTQRAKALSQTLNMTVVPLSMTAVMMMMIRVFQTLYR